MTTEEDYKGMTLDEKLQVWIAMHDDMPEWYVYDDPAYRMAEELCEEMPLTDKELEDSSENGFEGGWKAYNLTKAVPFINAMSEEKREILAELHSTSTLMPEDRGAAYSIRKLVGKCTAEELQAFVEAWREYDLLEMYIFLGQSKETLTAWSRLNHWEKGEVNNFSPSEFGHILRNWGTPYQEDIRTFMDVWDPKSVDIVDKEFVKLFNAMPEEHKEGTAFAYSIMHRNMTKSQVRECTSELSGNPQYMIVANEMKKCSVHDYWNLAKDVEASEKFMGCSDKGLWASLYNAGVPMQNLSHEETEKLVELASLAENDWGDFVKGAKEVIAEGTVMPWADYVWGQITKDTVGGGNYRFCYAREAA